MGVNDGRDWVRSWMALGAAGCPGEPDGFDREAFDLAAEDLAADGVPVPSDPDELDLLGELATRMDRVVPDLLRRALAQSPEARAAMEEISRAFRVEAGDSRADPVLRERRRHALDAFLEALSGPLERRIANLERTRLRRGWRQARRNPRLADPDLARDPAARTPDAEALARELGERAALRIRRELAPRALEAVTRRLRDADPGHGGLSPATFCRALQKVRAVAAEEFAGAPPALLDVFWASLVESLPPWRPTTPRPEI